MGYTPFGEYDVLLLCHRRPSAEDGKKASFTIGSLLCTLVVLGYFVFMLTPIVKMAVEHNRRMDAVKPSALQQQLIKGGLDLLLDSRFSQIQQGEYSTDQLAEDKYYIVDRSRNTEIRVSDYIAPLFETYRLYYLDHFVGDSGQSEEDRLEKALNGWSEEVRNSLNVVLATRGEDAGAFSFLEAFLGVVRWYAWFCPFAGLIMMVQFWEKKKSFFETLFLDPVTIIGGMLFWFAGVGFASDINTLKDLPNLRYEYMKKKRRSIWSRLSEEEKKLLWQKAQEKLPVSERVPSMPKAAFMAATILWLIHLPFQVSGGKSTNAIHIIGISMTVESFLTDCLFQTEEYAVKIVCSMATIVTGLLVWILAISGTMRHWNQVIRLRLFMRETWARGPPRGGNTLRDFIASSSLRVSFA